MIDIKVTGGARIGRANTTWPFATLKVTRDKLELNASVIGNLVFRPIDIISIVPQNGLLSKGLRIIHKVPTYKDCVIFWTLGNPNELLKRIEKTGFLTNCSPLPANAEAETSNSELANREAELYSIVLEARGTMEDKAKQLHDNGVFDRYKEIHSSYADNSHHDLESLKRGLFIQWYAMTEPPCYTGINELDMNSERKIIKQLNKHIVTGNLDDELKWMLKYYCNWDYVFERFEEFKELQDWVKNQKGTELPDKIDRNDMAKRGQMGEYWNSLNPFV